METDSESGYRSDATEVGSSDAETVGHKLPLICLDWSSNVEIYHSNDHSIYKQNMNSCEAELVPILPSNFIPADIHWLLMGGMSSGEEKGSDTLLICSRDGRFILHKTNTNVVLSIAAHFGAIASGRWSPDGAGFLTAGEDGDIKIWSHMGMLGSTIIQAEEPITCARWSSQSDCIVFSQGGYISLKPLAHSGTRIRWRAHEGRILSLSWSFKSHVIASGGEDLRYKIWNSQGLHLFTSVEEEYPITLVSFNNEHDSLLVGGFDLLKLCSITGRCFFIKRFHEPSMGSLLSASWSPDGRHVCCGTFNGSLIVGQYGATSN